MKIKRKCLLFVRIKRELSIWLLFLFCLYIVIAYHFDSWKIPFSFISEKATQNFNEIFLWLSYSYVAGMIFYILSIFYPKTKKTRAVLSNVTEDLRLLKDEYYDFSLSIFGQNCLNDNLIEKDLFKEITGKDFDSLGYFPISINKNNCKFIEDFIDKSDKILSIIMNNVEYLTYEEYLQLAKIRTSYSFQHVKIHFRDSESTPYYNKEGWIKFIKDLIETNTKVVKLYDEFNTKYGNISK